MSKKISYTNEEEFQSYIISLYEDEYFSNRVGQDIKRQKQFELEKTELQNQLLGIDNSIGFAKDIFELGLEIA